MSNIEQNTFFWSSTKPRGAQGEITQGPDSDATIYANFFLKIALKITKKHKKLKTKNSINVVKTIEDN